MGVLIVNKKDTYVYELKDANTIVYYGISDQLSEREEQHQRSDKDFTHMNVITGVMFRKNALEREKEEIQRYQRQHGGNPPKYNKNKTY